MNWFKQFLKNQLAREKHALKTMQGDGTDESFLTVLKNYKFKDWLFIAFAVIYIFLSEKIGDENVSVDRKFNVIGPILFILASYGYYYFLTFKPRNSKKNLSVIDKLAVSLTILPVMIMAVLAFVWYKFSWITEDQLYSFFPMLIVFVPIGLVSMFILGVIKYYKRRVS